MLHVDSARQPSEDRLALLEQPTRTAEDEEFLMDTQDIVQQLKDEGRRGGREAGVVRARWLW
jgi:hypothetical protein